MHSPVNYMQVPRGQQPSKIAYKIYKSQRFSEIFKDFRDFSRFLEIFRDWRFSEI